MNKETTFQFDATKTDQRPEVNAELRAVAISKQRISDDAKYIAPPRRVLNRRSTLSETGQRKINDAL